MLASWVLRQDGRADPASSPTTCAARWRRACAACATATRARPSKPAREVARAARRRRPPSARPGRSRPSASGCSRRSSPTCSPPAARTRTRSSRPPRSSSASRSRTRSSRTTSSLLNLVNFGGGCYAVYAELHGDEVHVDKELWGDTFRSAPRLTPLEARAIRLALEFVGPLIAAEAHRPLDRVRKKLEETFGEFELAQTPAAELGQGRGGARRDADRRDPPPPARRARVPEGGGGHADDAPRRAVHDRAAAPALVRPHLGPHARRRAQLPARPDAQRDPARARSSSRARASSPGQLERRARRPRALLARRRPLGGRARRARRCPTARRSTSRRSAARSGSSARSSATAARPSCSSRRSCAAAIAKRAQSLAQRARRHPAAGACLAASATRQLEREGRALAGRRAHRQRAAVRLGDRAGDEEPEARCPACRRRRWRGRTSRRSGPAARAGCPGPRSSTDDEHAPVLGPGAGPSTSPPAGEYLTAFSTRFVSTWLQPLAVAAHARERRVRRLRDDADLVLARARSPRRCRGRARRRPRR